jgi:hypothetical protein
MNQGRVEGEIGDGLNDDPAEQYRRGLISHPEMLSRRSSRTLKDLLGFSFIFVAVIAAMFSAGSLLPPNDDNSIGAGYLIAILAMVGIGGFLVLWRGTPHRPWRWAGWAFLILALVIIPIALIFFGTGG